MSRARTPVAPVQAVLTLCAASIEWVAKGAIPVHGESHVDMSGTTKFVFVKALRRVNMKNHGVEAITGRTLGWWGPTTVNTLSVAK